MSLLGSNLYCVPWNTEKPYKRKPRKPKMSPEERLLRILSSGRRPTIAEAKGELQLERNSEVYAAIARCDALGVNTTQGKDVRGRPIPIDRVVPIEEEI